MTKMSNTAHQREVKDLRKAGLNPILSVNSGANSYSGSQASGPSASSSAASTSMATASGGGSYHSPIMQNALGNAISTALDTYTQGQNVNESQARIQKISAEITAIGKQIGLTEAQTSKIVQELINLRETAKQIYENIKKTKAEAQGITFENIYKGLIGKYYRSNQPAVLAKEFGITNAAIVDTIGKINAKLFNIYNHSGNSDTLNSTRTGRKTRRGTR